MERITFDSCIRKRKKASNSGVGHMKREEKASKIVQSVER